MPAGLELPVAPMMAAPGQLPAGAGWAYEMKWDGVRVVAAAGTTGSAARLWSRAGRDITAGYPELSQLSLPVPAVLDGEIVALDPAGVPSFQLLQQRMHVRDVASLVRLVREVPVCVRVFDLLALDGRSLLSARLAERRQLLENLPLEAFWEVPAVWGDGAAAFAASRREGIEGVVAKRLSSRYHPGRRSPDWVKVKHSVTRDAILCGWHPGTGNREGGIGSFYLAAYETAAADLAAGDPQGADRLVLIGKVGSGLNHELLAILRAELADLEIDQPPCEVSSVAAVERRQAHWLEPVLVCEVEHLGWTAEHRLRFPVWRGLRLDIDPAGVRR